MVNLWNTHISFGATKGTGACSRHIQEPEKRAEVPTSVLTKLRRAAYDHLQTFQ